MAACEISAYLGIKASVDLPQIHFIRRPRMEADDAICVLSLIPEAQAHFSFVTLLEAEACFLFWNEFLAIKLEMTKGQYFQLRRHVLWRKYMFVTPAGMVAMLEDMDAAVYVPYVDFQAKYALKMIDPP
ncbi:hypothetical protein [Pseudomonas sp. GXZC]|uniref:hypothetical protein n=1 Tax=Pseudomonas sp. GXZC TaxID=3003351 RepID=UPI0022AA3BC5|nr:hypothetical protein [Pseudomonas sp. GXZC]WAT32081.1 hypothetical protein OZ428_34030 [Pseudomonas sp. GXZC]